MSSMHAYFEQTVPHRPLFIFVYPASVLELSQLPALVLELG